MKTRTDLLNFLAEKYNLNRYLEIGVQNTSQNFNKIICKNKVGVDPNCEPTRVYGNPLEGRRSEIFAMTSDEFFEGFTVVDERFNGKETKAIVKNGEVIELYDLIFIDGLHHADQVKKDFENSLQVLSPNGFIVIHDCNPEKEEHTIVPRPTKSGHWHGDVYKYAIHIDVKHTVDIDCGCLVYRNRGFNPTGGYDDLAGWKDIDWDYFDQNRKELLNLVSWDDFVNSHL